MSAPRIKSVRMLRNHGAVVTTVSTRHGERVRFERPDGKLSTFEAAMLLKTYPNMVVRMVKSGRLTGSRDPLADDGLRVDLASVRALLRLPAARRLGVLPVGAAAPTKR